MRGLLTAEEIAWLDAYHALVRNELEPALDAETRKWLQAATAPIAIITSHSCI